MAAIFLSDAHLKNEKDQSYKDLVLFLDTFHRNHGDEVAGMKEKDTARNNSSGLIRNIGEFYIVGDFFDFWFSKKDRIYPGFRPIVNKLVALKKRGIHVHFCEGNHDFLLEDYFSDFLNIPVTEEWLTINLDGKRVLISHGDTIDKTDRSYLFLRSLLRSGVVRFLKKWLPQPVIWWIARKSSEISKAASGNSKHLLVEKMYQFALEKFAEGFDAVILGHCHMPVLRETSIAGGIKTFVTLGDWLEHNSYLYYANGRFELSFFK